VISWIVRITGLGLYGSVESLNEENTFLVVQSHVSRQVIGHSWLSKILYGEDE
jgi:hypothetical protein